MENLQKYTQDFIAALNRRPEISMAYTTFDTKFPQYMVEVDAVKCQRAGVTTSDVLSVLSGYIGGNYSSNLNRFSKLYRVMIQARKDYRLDKESLNNMFVRTESGEMAPVGQFITLTKVYGAETLTRFNMYTLYQSTVCRPTDIVREMPLQPLRKWLHRHCLPDMAMSSAVLPEKNQAVREIR